MSLEYHFLHQVLHKTFHFLFLCLLFVHMFQLLVEIIVSLRHEHCIDNLRPNRCIKSDNSLNDDRIIVTEVRDAFTVSRGELFYIAPRAMD